MRKRKTRAPADRPLPNLTASEHGFLGLFAPSKKRAKKRASKAFARDGSLTASSRDRLDRIATKALGIAKGRSPDDLRQERGYLERLCPEIIENYAPQYADLEYADLETDEY